MSGKQKRILCVLLVDVTIVLAIWALAVNWRWVSNHLGDCPFHRLTGLNCPGCGGSRMVRELLHGAFGRAFQYNPLLFLIGAYMVASWLLYHAFAFGGCEAYRVLVNQTALWVILIASVLFALTRNIPVWPFTWLSP